MDREVVGNKFELTTVAKVKYKDAPEVTKKLEMMYHVADANDNRFEPCGRYKC